MATGILALKLTLAPALVAAATRVARRMGHRAGGLVAGLPVVAAPILLIYALEHGEAFAQTAAAATVLGVASTVAFCVAYALVAPVAPWPVALAAGWGTFGALTVLLAFVTPSLVVSTVVALAAVAGATWLLHRLAPPPDPDATPRSDLLVWRLVITAALVVALTALAGAVSAHVAGLLAPFPVITAVLAAFTQARAGAGATILMLSGLVPALASFVLFFAALAALLSPLGIGGAFAAASAIALAGWSVLLWRA